MGDASFNAWCTIRSVFRPANCPKLLVSSDKLHRHGHRIYHRKWEGINRLYTFHVVPASTRIFYVLSTNLSELVQMKSIRNFYTSILALSRKHYDFLYDPPLPTSQAGRYKQFIPGMSVYVLYRPSYWYCMVLQNLYQS